MILKNEKKILLSLASPKPVFSRNYNSSSCTVPWQISKNTPLSEIVNENFSKVTYRGVNKNYIKYLKSDFYLRMLSITALSNNIIWPELVSFQKQNNTLLLPRLGKGEVVAKFNFMYLWGMSTKPPNDRDTTKPINLFNRYKGIKYDVDIKALSEKEWVDILDDTTGSIEKVSQLVGFCLLCISPQDKSLSVKRNIGLYDMFKLFKALFSIVNPSNFSLRYDNKKDEGLFKFITGSNRVKQSITQPFRLFKRINEINNKKNRLSRHVEGINIAQNDFFDVKKIFGTFIVENLHLYLSYLALYSSNLSLSGYEDLQEYFVNHHLDTLQQSTYIDDSTIDFNTIEINKYYRSSCRVFAQNYDVMESFLFEGIIMTYLKGVELMRLYSSEEWNYNHMNFSGEVERLRKYNYKFSKQLVRKSLTLIESILIESENPQLSAFSLITSANSAAGAIPMKGAAKVLLKPYLSDYLDGNNFVSKYSQLFQSGNFRTKKKMTDYFRAIFTDIKRKYRKSHTIFTNEVYDLNIQFRLE